MSIIIDEEFKNLIPPLSTDEYAQLEENCVKEGIRDALIVWETPNGSKVLVDGHNRFQIAARHGLHWNEKTMQFASRDEARAWIIRNQFGRRNLSAYDRSVLALKLKPIIVEQAKEKQATHTEQGYQKSDKPITTGKELAKIAGVSHDTIHKVEAIEKSNDEKLKEQVRSGDVSINQGYQKIKRDEKKKEVIRRIENYADVQTGVVDIRNAEKKYNIIYADPPWKYWESGNKNQELHYTTMTIDEICDLPVKDIAADDCVLFLWVTYPILQEAFRVIESWGFKYSTAAFVWVKKNKHQNTPFVGCGSWTRANSELCLLATKGNVMRLDASISQIVENPIEEHSKKPDVVRTLITKLVGELPRVELFCRNPAEGKVNRLPVTY